MTDATPAPVQAVKPASKQISNYVGATITILGNLLPVLIPVLPAVGVPLWAIHLISSVVGTALVAYQEKESVK